MTLDAWQEQVLAAALGERSDATWAAKQVGLSVPRQNGKSQLMVARILAGVLLFGERKIVVSAHQQDTAREAFAKLNEIIEDDGNAALRSRVKSVMNALNRESVKFTNGATVQFKARSGAGGKGFSSDCLLLDEAQILGSRAWSSILSTTSAMANPQVWLLGTPPQDEDDSHAFSAVRKSALSGKSAAVAWCEWGVDVDSEEFLAARADLKSRTWTHAVEVACWSGNPAWNIRLNHEIVRGEFDTFSPSRFLQDRLGVWADATGADRAITADEWDATGVPEPPLAGVKTFGVAFSFEGDRIAVAGALKHADGVHVELVGAQTGEVGAGISSMADWLAERKDSAAQIVVCGDAGAPALIEALRARGVPERLVIKATTAQYTASCAMTLEAIRARELTHLASDGQRVLDGSVAVCDKKSKPSGAWGWAATTPDGDETPLEAVSLALWAAKTTKRRPGRKAKVAY